MQSFPLAKMFVLWAAWAAQGAAQAAVDSNVAQGPPSEPALVQQAMQALAVPFEANGGQFDERVAFVARTFAGAIYVTRQGRIVYSLPGPVAAAGSDARAHAGKATPPTTRKAGWSLTETLAGAMPLAPVGGDAATAQVTRFSGPHGYQAATYRNVHLGQAWPGVAVELAARGSNVEKLFHVAPHADAGQIQVRVDGALSLRLGEGGELIATTGHGDVAYTAPVAFQEIEGRRVDVPVRYALSAAGDGYGFALGAHDRRLPLVIDPLLQSTYLGGAGGDEVWALALDTATGDVVVGGMTWSTDFPGTQGGAQPVSGGNYDAFVARLSGDLKTLRQSTYLGGAGEDDARALVIDAATGDVVIGGTTQSTDFPGTPGGVQPVYGGGTKNGFVARLSADFRTLRQSTYLGESEIYDGASVMTLAMDVATGDVVVGGRTTSTHFPGTAGGAQPVSGSGLSYDDGFVARLSGDLRTLRQSTYLGGSMYDSIYSLAIEAGTGDVMVGGRTGSADFPGIADGAQPAYGGGYYDGFVARLSGDLRTLRQSTYLGGWSDDFIDLLALDAATGDAVVGGKTRSGLPGTSGGAQPVSGGGHREDGFLARLSGDLKTLRQSTYLGGASWDYAKALAIDAATGDVVVGGSTQSTNFPDTPGGAQPVSGGNYDAFVARLSGDLKTLRQSTYLGGAGEDYVNALVIDTATGDVVVGGWTGSTDFPGTQGGAQPAFGGNFDAFVARLSGDLKAISPQAIIFPPQPGQNLVAGGRFAIDPPATASSGLPVSYASATPAVCTVSGSTVTMVGAGTCTLVASQGGNAQWLPAADATQNVLIQDTTGLVPIGPPTTPPTTPPTVPPTAPGAATAIPTLGWGSLALLGLLAGALGAARLQRQRP